MACPLDPSDAEWSQASATVCRIIGRQLGDVRFRARELVFAMVNERIAAADVTADPAQSAGRREAAAGHGSSGIALRSVRCYV